MSSKVLIDRRQQEFMDELKNNRIAIENIKRDNKESAVFWKLSQLEMFPEAIDLNPQSDSLKNLISEETTKREVDPNLFSQDVFKKLLKITTKDIATYIILNLTPDELLTFNRNFKKIVSDLKETNDSISKEQFISYIKNLHQETGSNNIDQSQFENGLSSFVNRDDLRNSQSMARHAKTFEELPDEVFSIPEYNKPVTTFFGREFVNKTQLRTYMVNKAKEEINDELDKFGVPAQPTKSKAISELCKQYVADPTLKISGKGLSNWIYVNKAKYFLEGDELKNNNIVIKSVNTKKILNNFKPVMKISKELRELILSSTKNNFNKEEFDKLSKTEKNIFKRFVRATKMNIDLDDSEEDELNNKRFHILMGEIQAGNNNPELIKEVRQYAVKGFNEGKLSRPQMNNILLDLSMLI